MTKEAIKIWSAVIAAVAAAAVVPEVRELACVHLGHLCSGQQVSSNERQKAAEELRWQRHLEEERAARAERERLEAEAQRKADEEKLVEARRKRLEIEGLRKAEEERLARAIQRSREPGTPPSNAESRTPRTVASERTPKPSLGSLDGVWFSDQHRYGFRIEGNVGIATISNSPKFSPGDQILRFEQVSDASFRGEQIFTDGRWRPVSGQLIDQQTLKMQWGGYIWTMSKR